MRSRGQNKTKTSREDSKQSCSSTERQAAVLRSRNEKQKHTAGTTDASNETKEEMIYGKPLEIEKEPNNPVEQTKHSTHSTRRQKV